MSGIDGRVALVTGGSRGIGRAIAVGLAREGADVAINYRRDVEAAEAVVAEIEGLGRRAKAYSASVDVASACEKLVQEVAHDFGGFSILVNNAGIASRGNTVEETEPKEFDRVVQTHTFGSFYMSHFAVPHLKAVARGDIVMISSVATLNMAARGGPYNVGKAGIEALAATLSKELNQDGVYVNTVAPGLTVTDMGERLVKARSGVDISELDAEAPFGHVCRPEEVAQAVVYFCSAENSYGTGQKISLGGN